MKLALYALAMTACITSAQPVERVDLGPAPAPGPWSELRDALGGCALEDGVSGELRVRITIDPDGGAGSVSANRGGSDLASCIGRSLAHTRFPRDRRGHTIEVPFYAMQP